MCVRSVAVVRRRLELDDAEPVAETYVHLLADLCNEHGMTDRVVEFS